MNPLFNLSFRMLRDAASRLIASRLIASHLIAFCLLSVAFPASATAGETWEIPTTITPGTGLAATADIQGLVDALGLAASEDQVEISLEQLITLALQRNLTLVMERYDRNQAFLQLESQYGIYDFNLQVDAGFGEDNRPTGSLLEEADVLVSEGSNANFRLDRLLSTGATAQAIFNNRRDESSNNNFDPNPQYQIRLDLTFTQPLLRNYGKWVTERDITVAKTNIAINRADFQRQVENVIEQAVHGYWDLVEAEAQLEVAEESLALAEELHEMNEVQVEVGTLAPLELVQSEAGMASRQEDIIRLRALVQDRQDVLRRLINLDRSLSWETEIAPITDPEVEHRKIDIGASVETAFENRPEIQNLRLQNETRRLDAKVAHNRTKPRLDAQASYGLNGIDGKRIQRDAVGRPIPDPNNPGTFLRSNGDYTDALEQVTNFDFEGWSIGVTFAMPIENRTAKANAAIADLAVERGEVEMRDLEEQIFTEVRRTARAVETAAQQIATAKVSSRLARENLEAERKRYENGLSTSFQVLQIQEQLSEARSREVTAIIGYRRNQATFQKVTGTLLPTYSVRLAEDED